MQKKPGFWVRQKRLREIEKQYRISPQEKKAKIQAVKDTYEIPYWERKKRLRKMRKELQERSRRTNQAVRQYQLDKRPIIFTLAALLLLGASVVWYTFIPETGGTGEQVVANDKKDATTQASEKNVQKTAESVLADHFTIVLGSFQQQERAEIMKQEVENSGLDAHVWQSGNGDNTRWRVCTGSFENRRAAEQFTAELPSPYRDNNFIQQVQ